MTTFHRQARGRDVVGRLLQPAWRYKALIAAVVLLGALLGYGWAARQPVLYEGVSRVLVTNPGLDPLWEGPDPIDPAQYLRIQAEVMRSAPVLERAVKLSGNSISAETFGQRLEVVAAKDVDLLTIRVVDSTATGAARLADAVAAAYDQVLARQWRESVRARVGQLQNRRSGLETRLAEINAQLARNPNDPVLRARRAATAEQLSAVRKQILDAEATAEGTRLSLWERAAVPKQPISASPGRAMAIGMLVGLLASAVLVWWRTRRQGPPSGASASEQGPEMPSPA